MKKLQSFISSCNVLWLCTRQKRTNTSTSLIQEFISLSVTNAVSLLYIQIKLNVQQICEKRSFETAWGNGGGLKGAQH